MILFLLTLPLLAEIADPSGAIASSLQLAALGVAGLLILLSKISVGAILASAVGFLLWRRMGMTLAGPDQAGCSVPLARDPRHRDHLPGCAYAAAGARTVSVFSASIRAALCRTSRQIFCCFVSPFSVARRYAKGQEMRRSGCRYCASPASSAVLLINVPGGSDYYFVNVGSLDGNRIRLCLRRAHFSKEFFPVLSLPGFGCGDPARCACDRRKKESAYRLGALFAELQARVRLVTGESAGAETTTGQRLIALLTPGHQARYTLASDMKRTPGAQASETLLAMGITQAHRAAVFVPPDNVAFWTIAMECRSDPFFVPAILGAPMLKGLNPPALKCPSEPYYGFADYKDAKFRTVERPATLRPRCTLEFRYGIHTHDAHHRPKNSLQLRIVRIR